jgi:hypothetical protein
VGEGGADTGHLESYIETQFAFCSAGGVRTPRESCVDGDVRSAGVGFGASTWLNGAAADIWLNDGLDTAEFSYQPVLWPGG